MQPCDGYPSHPSASPRVRRRTPHATSLSAHSLHSAQPGAQEEAIPLRHLADGLMHQFLGTIGELAKICAPVTLSRPLIIGTCISARDVT